MLGVREVSFLPGTAARRLCFVPVRRGIAALTAALCLCLLAGCASPPARGPVGAFQAVVAWYYGAEPIGVKTFAIDAASTGLDDPSLLVDALRADPRYAVHEIIDATRLELEHEGRIKDLMFEDGFLLEFLSNSIADDAVTVRGQKWYSGVNAITATVTARWVRDRWVVGAPEDVVVA